MQHIRKTHHVNLKTAPKFSEKAYKDIITIEKTNPTDKDEWELKPHSNENIDISNKHGKIVFQCPLLRCESKLKHHSSVKDHLNKIHKIPRGEKMQDIVTHAQETFVESKSSCISTITGTLTSRCRIFTKFVVCVVGGYMNDWVYFLS